MRCSGSDPVLGSRPHATETPADMQTRSVRSHSPFAGIGTSVVYAPTMRAFPASRFLLAALLSASALADDPVLVGTCSAAGTVEVFFDVPPRPEAQDPDARAGVARAEVEVTADGDYELPIPRGAVLADLRVTTATGVHHGARVWLEDRRSLDVVRAEPIVCGELVPVRLEVEGADGAAIEGGSVYYFGEGQYPGDSGPLSPAVEACRRVAELDGSRVIELAGVPRAGGYLRIDAPDRISVAERLKSAPARGPLRQFIVLEFAPSVRGVAPGEELFGPEFEGLSLVIGAFEDPVASNGAEHRAFALHEGSDLLAHYVARAGLEFDFGGVVGYRPLLGAWREGRSLDEAPDLIATCDPRSGRYARWVEPRPTTLRVDLPRLPRAEAALLDRAPLHGNLWVSSTGGSYGLQVLAEWDGARARSLTARPTGAVSAGGQARLELWAGAARLCDQWINFVGGESEVTLDGLPELSEVTVVVTDRDTGEPVEGAIVDAFTEADAHYPAHRFETDAEGRASGLFTRGQEVRLVADPTLFSGAEPVEVVASRASIEVDVPVGRSFGVVEVSIGAIDDAACRVSLVPEQVPPFSSYRVEFPDQDASTSSWEVEPAELEVAAAAIRPGGSFVFAGVPAGKYIVAVQTHMDLDHDSVYADIRLSCGSGHARRIVVERGKRTPVEIAAPKPAEVSFPLVLPKALAKQLKAKDHGGLRPRFSATPAQVFPDFVGSEDPGRWTELGLSKKGRVEGELNEGWAYVVRVAGLGPVDSNHLVRQGEESELRLDGAIVFALQGRSKAPCKIEIRPMCKTEDGRFLGVPPPESSLEVEPKNGEIRLEGLSPFTGHIVRVSRDGRTLEFDLEPLVSDEDAKPDRRSGTLVREVSVSFE